MVQIQEGHCFKILVFKTCTFPTEPQMNSKLIPLEINQLSYFKCPITPVTNATNVALRTTHMLIFQFCMSEDQLES